MAIYLDSAIVDEAEEAFNFPWLRGITTNPTLLSRANLGVKETLERLCAIARGTVFYQLTEHAFEDQVKEGEKILAIHSDKLGLKIPCRSKNLILAHHFVQQGATVAITAIFSSAQVLQACEAGVEFIIPYVNRSQKLLGDGLGLIQDMRAVIDAASAKTEILAASIKSPEEAVSAYLAGAHNLSLPLDVLLNMGDHKLSEEAIKEFAESS